MAGRRQDWLQRLLEAEVIWPRVYGGIEDPNETDGERLLKKE